MTKIATSDLIDLRSAFSSFDDNIHSYRVLVNSGAHELNQVTFAKPQFIQSNNCIHWYTETRTEAIAYENLSTIEKIEVGEIIGNLKEQLLMAFGKKTHGVDDFIDKILKIPNTQAIFVERDSGGLKVIITAWGVLQDSLIDHGDVLYSLVPADEFPILVRVKGRNNIMIEGVEIELKSETQSRQSKTDSNGLARLGVLTRKQNFCVFVRHHTFVKEAYFVADGREFYEISILQRIKVNLKVKDEEGRAFEGQVKRVVNYNDNDIHFQGVGVGEYGFELGEGELTFHVLGEGGFRYTYSCDGNLDIENVIITINRPKTEEIRMPSEVPSEKVDEEELVNETSDETIISFKTLFNMPVKNKVVTVIAKNAKDKYVTDGKGRITISSYHKKSETKKIDITYLNSVWSTDITIEGDNEYRIELVPAYPYVWILLSVLACLLLLCCLFSWFSWCMCSLLP